MKKKQRFENFDLFYEPPFLFWKEFTLPISSLHIPFSLSLSLSVSFAGWRETQTKEDDKMSDEGMVTMDEDEEIGQVRFVEYICFLCFSLPFDRRDGGEMMIITSRRLHSSSSSSLVVSTARCCCANRQITRNSSFGHVCEKRERE